MLLVARTIPEIESAVGVQFRTLRIAARLTQAELAERASVSEGAIRTMELGRGTSLRTLVAVAKILGRVDWFDDIDDLSSEVDPLAMLNKKQRSAPVELSKRRAH